MENDNKIIWIYGAQGAGKSFLAKRIMQLCKENFKNIFIDAIPEIPNGDLSISMLKGLSYEYFNVIVTSQFLPPVDLIESCLIIELKPQKSFI